MEALIVPNVGTIVLREDGSVAIVDRARQQFILVPELVDALRRLLSAEAANA
jgi:hypothetical protein